MDKLDLQHRLSVPHNAKANQSFLTSGQRQNNSLPLLKLNKRIEIAFVNNYIIIVMHHFLAGPDFSFKEMTCRSFSEGLNGPWMRSKESEAVKPLTQFHRASHTHVCTKPIPKGKYIVLNLNKTESNDLYILQTHIFICNTI